MLKASMYRSMQFDTQRCKGLAGTTQHNDDGITEAHCYVADN